MKRRVKDQVWPERIRIAPAQELKMPSHRTYWDYFVNSAMHLRIPVQIDFQLHVVGPAAFEFIVDNTMCVFDFSDYLLIDTRCRHYEHWLRAHYNASLTPFPAFGSFPPVSFHDWKAYERLSEIQYKAQGDIVLHKQAFANEPHRYDITRRRSYARQLLTNHCGSLSIDTQLDDQETFWLKALEGFVSVHIPGTWPHILDRGQLQLMGLGVCTISPDIWTAPLGERPEPWKHYIPINDDFADLPSRIDWCRANRESCVEIGSRAKAYFKNHCTPEAAWRYVKGRVAA